MILTITILIPRISRRCDGTARLLAVQEASKIHGEVCYVITNLFVRTICICVYIYIYIYIYILCAYVYIYIYIGIHTTCNTNMYRMTGRSIDAWNNNTLTNTIDTVLQMNFGIISYIGHYGMQNHRHAGTQRGICQMPDARRDETRKSLRVNQFGQSPSRTKILGFRGFDSSRILTSRGGILRHTGDFPEGLSQRTQQGQLILVRRLGCFRHCRGAPFHF